jgi:hypothetical protein
MDLNLKEQTIKMEHLDNICVWLWKLVTSESRSEMPDEVIKIWYWGMIAEISLADHVKN